MKHLTRAVTALLLLMGLCACGQGPAEESSAPSTTIEVCATEALSGPIEHTAVKRIHDSLPEFTFALTGYDGGVSANISSIEITGEGFSQRLDADLIFESWALERLELSFEDFNNDGFLDLRMHVIYNHNGPTLFWLWDKDKHHFIANRQLQEINEAGYFELSLEEDGRVCGYPTRYNIEYYEFIKDGFTMVEQHNAGLEHINGGVYWVEEKYKLIDGDMRIISRSEENVDG